MCEFVNVCVCVCVCSCVSVCVCRAQSGYLSRALSLCVFAIASKANFSVLNCACWHIFERYERVAKRDPRRNKKGKSKMTQ